MPDDQIIDGLHKTLLPDYDETQFQQSFVVTAILCSESLEPEWTLEQHLDYCFSDYKEDVKKFLTDADYIGEDGKLNLKAQELDMTVLLLKYREEK